MFSGLGSEFMLAVMGGYPGCRPATTNIPFTEISPNKVVTGGVVTVS
jgi:hypothetical protein